MLNDAWRVLVRKTHGKRSRPTAAILDSQSVKSAGHGGRVGYDAGKRIKGRKRHLLVDTLGLVLGVAVTPASTTERDGAQMLLGRVLGWFTWLRILWVEGGYTGETFAQWVKGLRPKLAVEVVKRSDVFMPRTTARIVAKPYVKPVLAALEAYHKSHNQYPKTLDELQSEYPKALEGLESKYSGSL